MNCRHALCTHPVEHQTLVAQNLARLFPQLAYWLTCFGYTTARLAFSKAWNSKSNVFGGLNCVVLKILLLSAYAIYTVHLQWSWEEFWLWRSYATLDLSPFPITDVTTLRCDVTCSLLSLPKAANSLMWMEGTSGYSYPDWTFKKISWRVCISNAHDINFKMSWKVSNFFKWKKASLDPRASTSWYFRG